MRRLSVGMLLLALIASLATSPVLFAQPPGNKRKPPPKPRKVPLVTKDGVELSGFYFGSNRGKNAIPVIVIHEWKGQKALYAPLYVALSKAGCAVLTLDYRGHGGSREYTDRSGKTKEFDLKTMNKQHVGAIVQYDLDAAKKFLEQENNEEKLNLNALVVIGVRDGSVLAAGWTQRDWSFQPVGSRKQGQDVKALVLISPKRQLKGVGIEGPLAVPTVAALPTMMVVGRDSLEESDTKRIYKRSEGVKKRMAGGREAEGLELLEVPQSLGGADLLKLPNVIPKIVEFVTTEVEVSDVDNPWVERE